MSSYLSQFPADYDAFRAQYPAHWQNADILDSRFSNIKALNVTSQFGEDGLIAGIFDVIGVKSKTCFEVGASDGIFFSNTKALRNAGWRAVLVEGNQQDFFRLMIQARRFPFPTCKCEMLTEKHGLDLMMSQYPEYDLGVIDTDGDDIGHWKRMVTLRPRVIVIECQEKENPEQKQASVESLIELGNEKKYTAVARTYCNLIFVANEALSNV